MAIPANTYHATVQGTMPGSEVFAWGWWIRRGGDQGASASVQAADILADPNFRAFITQARALASTTTTYVSLLVQRYGAGGRVDDTALVGLGASAGAGTANSYKPNYVAFCITLRDGSAGASHRNRFYVPANGFALDATGQMSATNAQAVIDVAAAYWVGGTAVVLSPKLGSSQPVTLVTADTKLDTQRGRNQSAVATRVQSAG